MQNQFPSLDLANLFFSGSDYPLSVIRYPLPIL